MQQINKQLGPFTRFFAKHGYATIILMFLTIIPIGLTWLVIPMYSLIVWGFWVEFLAPITIKRAMYIKLITATRKSFEERSKKWDI